MVLVGIDRTWTPWTKISTSTKSSWEEECHMIEPFDKSFPSNLFRIFSKIVFKTQFKNC